MRRNETALLPKLPLLITESADEFDALRDAFEREIKPRGIMRRVKVALIERTSAFGELNPPRVTVTQMIQLLNAVDRGRPMPKPIDASATMPSQEPERLAEAVRRVLPQLRKLDRYERRAAAQRERAVLVLIDRIKFKHNL